MTLQRPVRAGFHIEPLGRQHDRAAFSCGHPSLDRFLKEQALQQQHRKVSVTQVLVAADRSVVLGYHTLSQGSVPVGTLPESVAKRLPRYPQLPVTLLGRLAIDIGTRGQGPRGQGLGAMLLLDALAVAYTTAMTTVGAIAVVVDAIDDDAVAFYRHYGFEPFPDTPDRLFLSMDTIAQIFIRA